MSAKAISSVVLVCVLFAGCGDDDGPAASTDAGIARMDGDTADGGGGDGGGADAARADGGDGGTPPGDRDHVIVPGVGSSTRVFATFIAARPAVIFHDAAAGALKLAAAVHEAPTRSSDWTVVTLIEPFAGPFDVRMERDAISIAYHDATARTLRFARSPLAPSGPGDVVSHLVDDTGDVGSHLDLSLRGPLAIAYYDATDGDLEVAVATVPAPTATADWTKSTIDAAGDVGQYPSVVATADGVDVAYYDVTNGDLKFNRELTAPAGIEVVDSVGDVGRYATMLEGGGIVYYDADSGDLKLADEFCMSATCTWTAEVLDGADGDVGREIRTASRAGYDWVSYQDVTRGVIRRAYRSTVLGTSPFRTFDAATATASASAPLRGYCQRESIEGVGDIDGHVAYVGGEGDLHFVHTGPSADSPWFVHRVRAAEIAPSGAIEYPSSTVFAGRVAVLYAGGPTTSLFRASVARPRRASDYAETVVRATSLPRGDLLAAGGRLAYVYRDATSGALWYLGATVPDPAGPADWESHLISAPAGASRSIVGVVGDRVVVAYFDAASDEVRLLRPTSATPAATSDWVEHAIASSPYVNTLGTRIVDDAGYAALIIATDDELRFARATTLAPAAATDWAISPAGSGVLDAGVLLRLASGWGVFASGEYRTTAAAVPAMASDWSMPEVVTYAPVHVAGGMEYMGKPWIAWWEGPDADSGTFLAMPPDEPLPDPRGLFWLRETIASDTIVANWSYFAGSAPYLVDGVPAATIYGAESGCVSLALRE